MGTVLVVGLLVGFVAGLLAVMGAAAGSLLGPVGFLVAAAGATLGNAVTVPLSSYVAVLLHADARARRGAPEIPQRASGRPVEPSMKRYIG